MAQNMTLKASNQDLIKNAKKTYLTAALAAAGTTMTVKDNTGATYVGSVGNFMIIGEIGAEGTEIKAVNGAVTAGTSITVAAVTFAHGIDTPVYFVNYDKVCFSRATTLTGTKLNPSTGVAGEVEQSIDPSEYYSYYLDTTNTTGYGFVRWKNSTTGVVSSYSGGVNYSYAGDYSSYDRKTLFRMTERVRKLFGESSEASAIEDDEIRDALNTKQEDISTARHWKFYEAERSQSSVADKFSYTIDTEFSRIQHLIWDTQPLTPVSNLRWKGLHWDNDSTATTPSLFRIFDTEFQVFPRPSGTYYKFIIDSEVIYASGATSTTFTGCLRGQENSTAATHLNVAAVTERSVTATATTLGAAITSTTATSITVASSSGFVKFSTTTTAINDADDITASDTIIVVDSTSGFKRGDYYRFQIESEIIYATRKTTTQFEGCLRGKEGTTAATHADNTIVTELDIVMLGQLKPIDMFLSSDKTFIPEPSVLETGAAAEIAYGTLDDKTLGDRLNVLYDKKFKQLEEKYSMKEYGQFGRVKLKEEIISDRSVNMNPNMFPSDIVGS